MPVISRGVVENATSFTIEKIEVLHLPTRAMAMISPVLAHQQAETGFQPTELKATKAELKWYQHKKVYRKTLLMPKWQTVDDNQQYVLLYRIHPNGEATVHLLPRKRLNR